MESRFKAVARFMGTAPIAALAFALWLYGVGWSARAADAPLADAAEKADWARVRTFLADGAAANAAQVDGMTALHWAAYHDQVDAAKLLIAAGPNPHPVGGGRRTRGGRRNFDQGGRRPAFSAEVRLHSPALRRARRPHRGRPRPAQSRRGRERSDSDRAQRRRHDSRERHRRAD